MPRVFLIQASGTESDRPPAETKAQEPVEYESRVPYSLRYTELGRFKQAETTDDTL